MEALNHYASSVSERLKSNVELIGAELRKAERQTSTPTYPDTWDEDRRLRFETFINKGKFNDLDQAITRPNFRFNINGVDCVPSGEIIAVAGKPGAGKSTALAIFIGVLIGRTDFAQIRCLTPCEKVLWIDTEKGNYTCQQKMKIFRKIANMIDDKTLEQHGIDFYMMRAERTEDRLFFAEYLAKRDDYDCVIIDGIFDLTDDPDKNYTPVIDLLKKMADGGASVFSMLHTNKAKDDDNMRYALGSELQRISTTRFTIIYDKTTKTHTIRHDKSNDSPLAPPVVFAFGEDGSIESYQAKNGGDVGQRRKEKGKAQLDFMQIFDTTDSFAYTDLINQVIAKAGVGKDAAKKRIKKGYDDGYLRKDDDGNYFIKKDGEV